MRKWTYILFLVLVFWMPTGCGSDAGELAPPAMVTGTIVDSSTNALVAQPLEVTVQGQGRDLVTDVNNVPTTTFTVEDGMLSFLVATSEPPSENAPVGITLVVIGNGLVPTSLPLIISSKATEFTIKTTRRANPPSGVATGQAQGEADSMGMVTSPIQLQTIEPITGSKTMVTIPAGTVITDATGAVLTGALIMDNAYFSPTLSNSVSAFPGGFAVETTDANGNTTSGNFVTAGLISVEITDQNGRHAKNFSGSGIQINIDIPPRTINPQTNRYIIPGDQIGLFSNDTNTGRWFEEGTVTVAADSNQGLIAVFAAKHLSLWNLDFKVNRCPAVAPNPEGYSRAFTVLAKDPMGVFKPVCAGKMKAMRIALSLSVSSRQYNYTFAPSSFEPSPEIVQFRNAPQLIMPVSLIEFVDPTDPANPRSIVTFQFDNVTFPLCPSSTLTTGLLPINKPETDLPGSC